MPSPDQRLSCINVRHRKLIGGRVHTDSGSRVFVACPGFALPSGVFDVVDDGVRDALGNNALYMSFLRGLPMLIRRAAVGGSDGFVVDGREGGGMLLGACLSAVFAGCTLLETAGSATGRAVEEFGVVKRSLFDTGDIFLCGSIGGTDVGAGGTSCLCFWRLMGASFMRKLPRGREACAAAGFSAGG
jgi:hypothetical protein